MLALLMWCSFGQPTMAWAEGYILYQQPGAYSLLVPGGSRYFDKGDLSDDGSMWDSLGNLAYELGVPGNFRYFEPASLETRLGVMVLAQGGTRLPYAFDHILMPLQLKAFQLGMPNTHWILAEAPLQAGGRQWRCIDGIDGEQPANTITSLHAPVGSRLCQLLFFGDLTAAGAEQRHEARIQAIADSFRLSGEAWPD